MKNPWEEIPLSDYENHMKLESVHQLQTMNEMLRGQFNTYPASSVMILGIAGGNGLEHIPEEKFERVYGVDVNSAYLKEATRRYSHLNGVLQCICIDFVSKSLRDNLDLPDISRKKPPLFKDDFLRCVIVSICFLVFSSKTLRFVLSAYLSVIVR